MERDQSVPLGVKPSWILYPERITDLAQAITRYVDRYSKSAVRDPKHDELDMIKMWAKEITQIVDMLKKGRK